MPLSCSCVGSKRPKEVDNTASIVTASEPPSVGQPDENVENIENTDNTDTSPDKKTTATGDASTTVLSTSKTSGEPDASPASETVAPDAVALEVGGPGAAPAEEENLPIEHYDTVQSSVDPDAGPDKSMIMRKVTTIGKKITRSLKKLRRSVVRGAGGGGGHDDIMDKDMDFSVFDTWRKDQRMVVEGSRFKVRNANYKKTGEKIASAPPLFEFIGADFAQAEEFRINHVAERFQPAFPAKKGWKPEWGVPESLIINGEVPYQSGSLWGAHPKDDLGYALLSYHQLSDASIKLLQGGKSSPALELLKQFIANGKSEKNGTAFKKIGQLRNVDAVGLPSFLKSYNGKPILVTGSCKIYTENMPRVLEIHYDCRCWAYAMRSALPTIAQKLPISEVEFGYLIEGKTEDELPEQLLACYGAKNLVCESFKKAKGRQGPQGKE